MFALVDLRCFVSFGRVSSSSPVRDGPEPGWGRSGWGEMLRSVGLCPFLFPLGVSSQRWPPSPGCTHTSANHTNDCMFTAVGPGWPLVQLRTPPAVITGVCPSLSEPVTLWCHPRACVTTAGGCDGRHTLCVLVCS